MAMHQNTTKMWHRKQCEKSYKIGWFVDLVTMALGWHLKALPLCIYIYVHIYIYIYIHVACRVAGYTRRFGQCSRALSSCPKLWRSKSVFPQIHPYTRRAAHAHSVTFAPIQNFTQHTASREWTLHIWGKDSTNHGDSLLYTVSTPKETRLLQSVCALAQEREQTCPCLHD